MELARSGATEASASPTAVALAAIVAAIMVGVDSMPVALTVASMVLVWLSGAAMLIAGV